MPILEYFCDFPLMSKKRPRANFETGVIHHDSDYSDWLELVASEIAIQSRQQNHRQPVRADALLTIIWYANGKSDPDNVEGAIWDGMQKSSPRPLVSDTMLSIPNHTTLCKPCSKTESERAKLWILYNATEKEFEEHIQMVLRCQKILWDQTRKIKFKAA